jgi:hypothetical protein
VRSKWPTRQTYTADIRASDDDHVFERANHICMPSELGELKCTQKLTSKMNAAMHACFYYRALTPGCYLAWTRISASKRGRDCDVTANYTTWTIRLKTS